MTDSSTKNVFWQGSEVSRGDRFLLSGHRSILLWFTGLSGSGKSTLSKLVERRLYDLHCRTMILDGDNLRHGLCCDLGFSLEDRSENIRRVGEVSKLFLNAGVVTLAAFISPAEKDRDFVKKIVGSDNFLEIYCKCSSDVCESRDVKGLYRKARLGQIKNFTGIDLNYDEPRNASLVVDTESTSITDAVNLVMELLHSRNIFSDQVG